MELCGISNDIFFDWPVQIMEGICDSLLRFVLEKMKGTGEEAPNGQAILAAETRERQTYSARANFTGREPRGLIVFENDVQSGREWSILF